MAVNGGSKAVDNFVLFGPCEVCDKHLRARPEHLVGHFCSKRADRWYPLDPQPPQEGTTAE